MRSRRATPDELERGQVSFRPTGQEFDEVAEGDVAVDATMDDLFLQGAIEPLGDAVGLGLGDKGRLDAPELDLVGEVVRQILSIRIEPPGKPHGDRLQGGEAVAALAGADTLAQCSTFFTVNTRTPSVPHMRFGA